MRVYVVTFASHDWRSELASTETVGVFLHEARARHALRERCSKEQFPDLAEREAEIHAIEVDERPFGDW